MGILSSKIKRYYAILKTLGVRSLLTLPVSFTGRFVLSLGTPTFDSIPIFCRLNEQNAGFQRVIEDALTLIRDADPHLYQMIIREVKMIKTANHRSVGGYYPYIKTCIIDYQKFLTMNKHKDYSSMVILCARIIVHEAMHGRLYSWGIPYIAPTKRRCEQICQRAEKRLLRRMQSNREFNKI